MKLTVFYDGQYWVGVVEESTEGKLRAGRLIFGAEPKDQEIIQFIYTKLLHFMDGLSEEVELRNQFTRKMNPKRLARMAAREVNANGVSTFAQAAIQLEYEKRKKEKQTLTRERREEMKVYKRDIKVQKAKEKHRGR
ncbi:YjdF family protein [Paenibacillus guangzhouensis]|uniref:YjdF family protein n=1 Tax=Paenibacillus guangzhouensis TaxID=1473112 RepID=UPI0012669B82|nr:YjdF family protein [Paenibacillus guangzhouensis]